MFFEIGKMPVLSPVSSGIKMLDFPQMTGRQVPCFVPVFLAMADRRESYHAQDWGWWLFLLLHGVNHLQDTSPKAANAHGAL